MARFSQGVDIAFRARLNDFKKEVESIPGITKKQSRAMLREWRKAQKDQEKLAADGAKVWAKATGEITNSLGQVVPGFHAVEKAASAYRNATVAADAATKRLWLTLGGIGVLVAAAAAVTAAGVKMTTALASVQVEAHALRGEIGDLTQDLGIGAETLSVLAFAAESGGIEFEKITAQVRKFGEIVYDYGEKGGGRAAEVFKELGIEVKRADGSFRDLDPLFRESIEKLGQLEDKAKKAALGEKLLGEEASKLIRVMGAKEFTEWVELTREFGVFVGPKAAAEAARLDAALRGQKVAWKAVALEAGKTLGIISEGDLADLFNAVSVEVVRFGSLFNDLVLEPLSEYQTILIGMAKLAINPSLAGIGELAGRTITAADSWEGAWDRAGERAEGIKKLLEAMGAAASEGAGDPPPLGGDDDTSTTSGMDSKAAAKAAGLQELKALSKQVADANLVGVEAIHAKYDAVTERLADLGELTGQWNMVEDAQVEVEKARQKELDAFHEEMTWKWLERELAADEAAAKSAREWKASEVANARAVRDARLGLAMSLVGLSNTVLGTVEGNLDTEKKEDKKAAKAIFATRKALAITNAVISTAAGVMKAIEMFGPPPSPLGIAGIAAAAVTGATQTALIAAQKPTFHVGGVGTTNGPAPDEMDMRVLRSEFGGMLTPTGLNRMGGPEAVHAANRGEGGAGGTTVIAPVILSGRVVEMGMVDAMRGTSSEVRSAVRRASRRPGHR